MSEPISTPSSDRTRIRPRRGPRKVTPSYLENAALAYLQRFASSTENLRRVLMRKVIRSARHHGTDADEGARLVEALIARYVRAGLLDDRLYAETKTRSLQRRGASGRMIRVTLRAKGLDADLVEAAVADRTEGEGDPDLAAAVNLARRRRLGPWRPSSQRAERRDRDLAALARAGFPFEVARIVVDAENVEALEETVGPGPG